MAKFKVITSRSNQGFFSQLFHTLQHLDAAEREGLIPIVYWSGGIYKHKKYNGKKTRNVWEFFFEPVSKFSFDEMYPKARANQYGDFPNIKNRNMQFVSKFRNTSLPHEPVDCWNTKTYPPSICLNKPSPEGASYIHGLIKKFVKIRSVVTDKVDDFYNKNLKHCKFISLHMRACNDLEPSQGYRIMARYLKKARRYLEDNPGGRIFVATDYEMALKQLVKEFGDAIIYRVEAKRSHNKHPLQYNCELKKKHRSPGAKVFEDVLIDALLLSKANRIYRGFSNVASAATFFNPNIESKYVPKYNKDLREYIGIDDKGRLV